MNETLRALPLATVGAIEGIYTYIVKPELKGQPVLAYALAGVVGGLVINALMTNVIYA